MPFFLEMLDRTLNAPYYGHRYVDIDPVSGKPLMRADQAASMDYATIASKSHAQVIHHHLPCILLITFISQLFCSSPS